MFGSTKKILIIFMICCLCTAFLASCSGGINEDEAKVFINDFFATIVSEDYEKAETFLHPDRPADLEAFLLSVEKEKNVDFQAGIEIEKYTNFSWTYYDGSVGGSSYELTMKTKVGENTVEITIEIVQNEAGYGIYNLNIDT